jgi:hypothetical protein
MRKGGVASRRSRLIVAALVGAALLSIASTAQASAALTFKRPNGSVVRMDAPAAVWCGPWETGINRRTIHVLARGPKRAWELSAVLNDIKPGRRISVPSYFVSDHPHGAFLFAYDGSHPKTIEVSTQEEEGSGYLSFSEASCELGSTLRFSIHAVLGTEVFNTPNLRVDGTFEAVIGEEPAAAKP